MAINFSEFSAKLKALFKISDSSKSVWTKTDFNLTLLLLLLISIAITFLSLDIAQTRRDAKFQVASADLQVLVQQAVRDAALATSIDNNASMRLLNVQGSVKSELDTMHALNSQTLFSSNSSIAGQNNVTTLMINIENIWAKLQPDLKQLSQAKVGDTAIANKLGAMSASSDAIIASAREAVTKYKVQGRVGLWLIFAIVAALVALGLLVFIAIRQIKRATQSFIDVEKTNLTNQEAILHLLDEMGDLADGDLTVTAQVSENITGAIADSINYTIASLRDLVSEIIKATKQVTTATEQAQVTSVSLLSAAEQQSSQIVETTDAVNNMTRSILQVSSNASQASEVAQRSIQVATQGSQAVQNTISGMNEIRTQIQETSKRIKRLGESSQEISEIVELISDITEQTNILALNAAIQAASAGEAGRGFTVVAEEVQRLAERSSEATKQISAIVKTIQTDTNSAVVAMEKSTEGVVEGARLSDAAGRALTEIETVSNDLARLIRSISSATVAQTEVAAVVTRNMQEIQNITLQTTDGTKLTAESVGQLNRLAEDLRDSVAGFKLA